MWGIKIRKMVDRELLSHPGIVGFREFCRSMCNRRIVVARIEHFEDRLAFAVGRGVATLSIKAKPFVVVHPELIGSMR